MTVVIAGEHIEVQELIERRRALGLDRHDEVWEGVYHVAPTAHPLHSFLQAQVACILSPRMPRGLKLVMEFNLGDGPKNYRVPDFGAVTDITKPYVSHAVMVGEILSPNDESYAKFGYYATNGVAEIVIIDPVGMQVSGYHLVEGSYHASQHINCANLSVDDLRSQLLWE